MPIKYQKYQPIAYRTILIKPNQHMSFDYVKYNLSYQTIIKPQTYGAANHHQNAYKTPKNHHQNINHHILKIIFNQISPKKVIQKS